MFAACMVATGDADAMVTGLTRSASVCLEDIGHAIGPRQGRHCVRPDAAGRACAGKTIFVADTMIISVPMPSRLADIVIGAAAAARHLGHEPRVALLSHSTFGDPPHDRAIPMRDAVAILDQRKVDFEYDGEMSPDVALEPSIRALYPFCRLTGDANVLVVPGLHSAQITVAPGASAGRRHHDRTAADRHGAAGADRADGCVVQPDRRSGVPGGLPGDLGIGYLSRAVRGRGRRRRASRVRGVAHGEVARYVPHWAVRAVFYRFAGGVQVTTARVLPPAVPSPASTPAGHAVLPRASRTSPELRSNAAPTARRDARCASRTTGPEAHSRRRSAA